MKIQEEKTFYKQLYQFADGEKSIVLEKSTERVFFRKEMTVYNREVYQYLWEHPVSGIPHIHEMLEEEGKLIVIEEYVPGVTLESILEERELSEKESRRILLDICDALENLHKADPPIIHRDIKPSNIMILPDGSAKLIDFDASKFIHDKKNTDTNLMGTPGFAAPEQYGFGQSEVRTDVYAVGVLAELLLGKYEKYRKFIEKAKKVNVEERYKDISATKEAIANSGQFPLIPPGFHSNEPRIKTLILDALYIFFFLFTYSIINDDYQKSAVKKTVWNRILDFVCVYSLFFAWIWITADWARICKKHVKLNRQFIAVKILLWALAMVVVPIAWLIIFTIIYKVKSMF